MPEFEAWRMTSCWPEEPLLEEVDVGVRTRARFELVGDVGGAFRFCDDFRSEVGGVVLSLIPGAVVAATGVAVVDGMGAAVAVVVVAAAATDDDKVETVLVGATEGLAVFVVALATDAGAALVVAGFVAAADVFGDANGLLLHNGR
jgi:hypothetical protein